MKSDQLAKMQAGRKANTGSCNKSPIHTIRAKNGLLLTLRLTRKLAMACFCTECLGWEDNPADCTAPLCPLYPFRAKTLRTQRGTIIDSKRAISAVG